MKKHLWLTAFFVIIIGALSYFTILDSEWRDGQVLEKTRKIYQKLYVYKSTNGKYPGYLDDVGEKENYCLLTFCYLIVYSPLDQNQNIVLVAKVNDPFIVYLSSRCPLGSSTTEENAATCASFAFKQDYQGNRTDFPIYRKDPIFTATPSAWPDIR